MKFFRYLMLCMGVMITTVHADTVRDSLLRAADTEASGQYTRERFLTLHKKPFDVADARKKALIIGDSHAQDFLNGVLENGYLANYQIRTRYIPFRCQVFWGEEGKQYIQSKDKALCDSSDNLQQAKAQIGEADLVILVSRWQEWAAKMLPKTLQALELRPDQRLVVVGRKDFGKIAIRKYLGMPEEALRTVANQVIASNLAINDIIHKAVGDAVFVDQHKLICGTGPTCRLFTDDLQLISFDGGHLTQAGAKHVGKLLFEGSLLGKL